MKKKTNIYLTQLLTFVVLFLICISCGSDDPSCPLVPCDPIDSIPKDTLTYDYSLLWEKAINSDTTLHIGGNLLHLNNKYLTYSRRNSNTGFKDDLISLNIFDGSQNWIWDGHVKNSSYEYNSLFSDQNLFVSTNEFLYKFNESTGDLTWKTEKGNEPCCMAFIGLIDDINLLGVIRYGNQAYRYDIISINKNSGSIDTLVTEEKTDSFWTSIQWPVTFINDNGDDMIIYNVVKSKSSPFESHAHLICRNLTQDIVVWRKDDFTAAGRMGGRNQPVIKDGRVYVLGMRTLHCFDLVTGEEYWKQEYLGTNFANTTYFIEEDIIVIISDEGDLVGIDINTGTELYIYNYSAYADGLTYHDGHIIYASEDLFFVDIKTGLIKHRFETKNRNYNNGYFTNRVAIDRDKEILYVIDNFFIQAIKMPDLN